MDVADYASADEYVFDGGLGGGLAGFLEVGA